jgi:hypothetical protein
VIIGIGSEYRLDSPDRDRHGGDIDRDHLDRLVVVVAAQSELLLLWRVDELDAKSCRRVIAWGENAIAAVRGDGVGALLVAKGGDPREHRSERGRADRYGPVLRVAIDRPVVNAIVPDPLKHDITADARLKELVGQPDDAKLGRRESRPNAIRYRPG